MKEWLFTRLPILFERGPAGLWVWQWLALPVLVVVAWAGGSLLSRLARRVLRSFAKRTAATWDDALLDQLRGPLTLAASSAVALLCLPLLSLAEGAEGWVIRVIRALFFLAFFWALLRGLSVLADSATRSTWAVARPASRALIPLASRVAKVALFGFALVALLADLGYPVASLIAGLGIGGLAVALAGQKTVENLFGAFSIGIDQPFREGDFVKIEDFVGTVETIGLRSTRIRTLDRTLISIPNGKLAEMRLESFAERDRIRLACTIGLTYETTADQMREILAGFERVLREQPKIYEEAITVRFKELGESALLIEVMAWFKTRDYGEFQILREQVLLAFMGVVEHAGSAFAVSTRTAPLAR